jgi:hypothetical protein
MNKLFNAILMFITYGVCSGQNLVPNPSFEIYSNCPQFLSQIDLATGWSSYKGTADLFHSCANTSQPVLGVPINELGHQNALDGNGYMRLINYVKTLSNAQEHAGIQLSQPLIIGQQYFVSFWVSRCDTVVEDCAINKIGAKFSTVQYSTITPDSLDNFAHVYTDSLILDKNQWFNIKGWFTADSAYSYLIIGNFFDDSHTDTAECGGLSTLASYFFDGICVSTDSLSCFTAVGLNEIKNQDGLALFPNPFSDKLNITTKKNETAEIIIYDIASRKILSQSLTNSTIINTEQLSKGIYLYEVKNKNVVIKKGKLVKN